MNGRRQPGRPVLIMAGGTGGHVFPAMAVAEELADLGIAVVWMCTRSGLEARVVAKAGIPIEWVRVRGIRGKGFMRTVTAPFMLLFAVVQAIAILLRVRPCVVLGMGGYLSGPGGLVAWMMRFPLLIHEQNSVAGYTNRLLAPLAKCVMEAFPGSLPARYEPVHTGNPVRRSIAAVPPPEQRLRSRTGPVHLLVLGGSQGAEALNEIVPVAVSRLPDEERLKVWHQAGKGRVDSTEMLYRSSKVPGRVEDFIEVMEEAYQWADLVVCRSGAMTVAEIAAVGVASVLVPYPHAVDDHQTVNARYLSEIGAAVLIPQQELTVDHLADVLEQLSANSGQLRQMAIHANKVSRPDAAAQVAQLCIGVATKNHVGKNVS